MTTQGKILVEKVKEFVKIWQEIEKIVKENDTLIEKRRKEKKDKGNAK
jgi:hypothetical protein